VEASVDGGCIDFGNSVAGMGEVEAKLTIVGHENEAFAFVIEATYGVEVLPFCGEELADGGTVLGIGAGADVAAGFMDGDVEFLFGFDWFSVDFDFVMTGGDFCAEHGSDLTIDGDAASQNDLFAGSSGGDSGVGEELLEADLHDLGRSDRWLELILNPWDGTCCARLGSETCFADRDYASGLVLRSPRTRSPDFHWPRFLSSATRSNLLRTLRFEPAVLTDRRLRCCDIKPSCYSILAYPPPNEAERWLYHGCQADANGFFRIL